MNESDALTGVVEPALPGMPEVDREATPFEDARDRATLALAMTQQRLVELRKQREETNAEIKLLVEEEELLERMTRIRKGARK